MSRPGLSGCTYCQAAINHDRIDLEHKNRGYRSSDQRYTVYRNARKATTMNGYSRGAADRSCQKAENTRNQAMPAGIRGRPQESRCNDQARYPNQHCDLRQVPISSALAPHARRLSQRRHRCRGLRRSQDPQSPNSLRSLRKSRPRAQCHHGAMLHRRHSRCNAGRRTACRRDPKPAGAPPRVRAHSPRGARSPFLRQ